MWKKAFVSQAKFEILLERLTGEIEGQKDLKPRLPE
jgi:hypothetical protein